jgi:hypothetical protein
LGHRVAAAITCPIPPPPASKGDFDAVLAEPHFRAGLLVPNYNDGDSPLLNVAPR